MTQNNDVALSGTIVDGLIELDLDLGKSKFFNPTTFSAASDGALLHSRLGHPGSQPLTRVFPGHSPPLYCDPCIMSKHHQLPYKEQFEVAREKLDSIHSDLSGIITPPSIGGSLYYFKITKSCTSFKFVYLLQNKSQMFHSFVQFKTLIKNQTSLKIKAMVNDNGGEYTTNIFESFVKKHGIRMHLTVPYTSQQNPVTKIGNCTTTEHARTLLKNSGMPTKFWAEAVSTAVYLENHTPAASPGFITPFKLWYGHSPLYDHLPYLDA